MVIIQLLRAEGGNAGEVKSEKLFIAAGVCHLVFRCSCEI